VAVLVPTFDRPAFLPDCLAAIAAELEAGDELWVAEGGDSRATDAPPVAHLDWRDADQDAGNALVYERGSGAYLGAALRRGVRSGWPLLKHRLGYARQLVAERRGPDRRFAWRATRAFAGGLVYGLRLPRWRG
jgi:hypothetical protein